MEDGCSPHRARAKARKNCVDFDEIDEFSNDQTKMGFHESLCSGPHELLVSFRIFFFIPFLTCLRLLSGKERRSVREEKLEFFI